MVMVNSNSQGYGQKFIDNPSLLHSFTPLIGDYGVRFLRYTPAIDSELSIWVDGQKLILLRVRLFQVSPLCKEVGGSETE